MKQNLPPARNDTPLIVLAVLVLAPFVLPLSGCARLPRSPSLAVQYSGDSAKAPTGLLININTAAAKELEALPGVGEVIAERIVAHREQFGPFRRAEHLLMVRGISDRKFRRMRTMIVVE